MNFPGFKKRTRYLGFKNKPHVWACLGEVDRIAQPGKASEVCPLLVVCHMRSDRVADRWREESGEVNSEGPQGGARKNNGKVDIKEAVDEYIDIAIC